MILRMLGIWSLVLLPFLKQVWTSGVHGSCIAEAWLGEFWALLYSCVRWVQLCGSLSILWHCLSLGLEWKLTLLNKQFILLINTPFSKHNYFHWTHRTWNKGVMLQKSQGDNIRKEKNDIFWNSLCSFDKVVLSVVEREGWFQRAKERLINRRTKSE